MILGIVGVEQSKLTPESESRLRVRIRDLFKSLRVAAVCSGECHLGGVDIIAKEEAKLAGLEYVGCPPGVQKWDDPVRIGYKQRNEQIAVKSDEVVCFSVKELPGSYSGMRFNLCYHCKSADHIKSGGCWTTKYARKLGKRGWTETI